MDILKLLNENENAILWIAAGLIFLICFIPILQIIRDKRLLKTVTSVNRGTKTERDLILTLLKRGIPAQTIFHDLYIRKQNGKFSQIDVVVATAEGILVFEVKDYSGRIYGDANYTNWTKVMAYGKKKYRFYNPIKQNNSHIQSLKKQLEQFKNIPFFSIILFYGNCELKEINYVPQGTYLVKAHRLFEVLKHIKKNNETAAFTDKWSVLNLLHNAVKNGEGLDNQKQHNEDIHDMLGKDRIYK